MRLSEAIEIDPRRDLKKGFDAPFIAMENLTPNVRDVNAYEIRKFSGSGSRFKNGDTLLARITPSLENGKTAFVQNLGGVQIGHGSTEFIVLSGKKGVTDNLFVYYLARTNEFREHAIRSMTGTSGRQRVQPEAIREYEIDLPNIEEQRTIANILGRLDDYIRLISNHNKLLEKIMYLHIPRITSYQQLCQRLKTP